MKLQKIILCTAIALCAFGASLGLLEIGAYIRAAVQPMKIGFKPVEPYQLPVYAPPQKPESAPPAVVTTGETAPEVEKEPEDWGNNGDYYIIGENPQGFEDFANLDVIDRKYVEKTDKVVSVKPQGKIELYLEKQDKVVEFAFSRIDIDGKRLSLATKTKRGVSYRFEGKFVSYDVELETESGDKYTETVNLKGRLSKWRDGKKIAEAKVRMTLSHGC